MERRYFLSRSVQTLLAGAGGLFGAVRDGKATAKPAGFLSACGTTDEGGRPAFTAIALDGAGTVAMTCRLPMRAHEIAWHPMQRRCLAVGRQPGRTCSMIDLDTGHKIHDLQIADGYDFNGHAIFAADGSCIIAAEQDAATSAGRLSFYDGETGRWLEAWSSHGLEPHELILDRDRNRLLVANGGIIDRNAVGEVDSCLVSLDLSDGAVLTRTTLPEELLSLSMRHMALTAAGDVVFGMQDQDPQSDLRPLVGLLDPAGKIRFLDIPRETAMMLRGYIGSVAVDSTGWVACATSPKGNAAMFWDLRRESWLGQVAVPDGCGVSASGASGGFIVTGGKGDVLSVATLDTDDKVMEPVATRLAHDARRQWDNHLTRIPV
jgi:hypothetical protein